MGQEAEVFAYVNTHPDQLLEKDYAASAVNAVAAATGQPWQQVYDNLVEQAKCLGLLPAEPVCVKELLRSCGFVQQPGHKEIHTPEEIRAYMQQHCHDGQVAVVKLPRYGWKGFAMAVVPGEGGYRLVSTEDRRNWGVEEIWIRWPDGQDHSPVRRRTGSGSRKTAQRKIPEDHAAFHYHQANPVNRFTGDCVVRGIAAACDIPWTEAMDRLARHRRVAVNNNDVFRMVLKDAGFVKCAMPKGAKPSGVEFCSQMEEKFHQGERIFACVGASHVAAVLPLEGGYRIVDTWDSSKRKITEYWVRQARPETPAPREAEAYQPGMGILHPTFGQGTVQSVIPAGTSIILDVAFPGRENRKLASQWVEQNCKIITRPGF